MIEVRNLKVENGNKSILKNTNFKWKNGLVYGIYGTRGAGKTAFLDILAGASAHYDGAVLINGFDIRTEPLKAREFIGYMPQNNALCEKMTPVEYLMYIADVKGMGYEKAVRSISILLDITGISPRRDCLIENLSPFEKRCIGIAQASLGKSDILIFDEPWKGLSSHELQKITNLLDFLSENATLIVSSIQKDLLNDICDRIFLLSDHALTEENQNLDAKEEN